MKFGLTWSKCSKLSKSPRIWRPKSLPPHGVLRYGATRWPLSSLSTLLASTTSWSIHRPTTFWKKVETFYFLLTIIYSQLFTDSKAVLGFYYLLNHLFWQSNHNVKQLELLKYVSEQKYEKLNKISSLRMFSKHYRYLLENLDEILLKKLDGLTPGLREEVSWEELGIP